MKVKLLMGCERLTPSLKKEIKSLINSKGLFIYRRVGRPIIIAEETPIGNVSSIHWNDRKQTNTMVVESNDPQIGKPPRWGYQPEFTLVRDWRTGQLHIDKR